MAFNGYSIDVASARGAISGARSNWSSMLGYESKVETDMDEAGTAAKHSSIVSALNAAFTGCIRPLIVTMVNSGTNTFTSGDNVITAYENGDAAMNDAAVQKRAVTDIEKATAGINVTPEYSPTTTSVPSPDGDGGTGG